MALATRTLMSFYVIKLHSVVDFLNRTLQVGLEPTTNRLTADRSTTELLKKFSFNTIKIYLNSLENTTPLDYGY